MFLLMLVQKISNLEILTRELGLAGELECDVDYTFPVGGVTHRIEGRLEPGTLNGAYR